MRTAGFMVASPVEPAGAGQGMWEAAAPTGGYGGGWRRCLGLRARAAVQHVGGFLRGVGVAVDAPHRFDFPPLPGGRGGAVVPGYGAGVMALDDDAVDLAVQPRLPLVAFPRHVRRQVADTDVAMEVGGVEDEHVQVPVRRGSDGGRAVEHAQVPLEQVAILQPLPGG